jgi:fucose permease
MLIFSAILATFVYGMIAAMLGTILPDLSGRFKLTPRQNGRIAFSQALGLVIASVGVGPLIDHSGKKIALVLGLALISIALFLLPRSSSFGTIAGYLFLLGLGGGILVVAANTLAGDVNPSQRGMTLNLLNLFFGLGGFATPFIAANLLKRNSMQLCYTVAVLTVIALAINAATPMPSPAPAAPVAAQHETAAPGSTGGETPEPPAAQPRGLLGNPVLWLFCVLMFLYVASEVGVWNWLVQHLIAQGIPEGRALNVLSFGFALGLLFGRVAIAPVLITVPAILVLIGAGVGMLVTTWAMLRSRTPGVAWVLVFIGGLAMAPVFPTTLAMVQDYFPPAVQATATGIVTTFGWIGLAVSSPIIGGIAGGDPRRLKKALLVLPVMAALIVVVNLVLRPYLTH